mgnify:CR=1 FL=1
MDLKTLKTFQSIVKHRSFNRAAQEMNYVQSTVTMQIQKLEADLGVVLIERGRDFRLTEAGRLFYEQSLQIVKQMDQLQSSITDMRLGEAGHVRLGVTEPTASCRLPAVLGRFMRGFPHIRISLEISGTPHLCERLLGGELDFAISTAPSLGTELEFEPLLREEFVLLLPEDHPLTDREKVETEHLEGHRLLITSATCPYRRKLESVMQEKGNVKLDTMEIGSMTALKFYVESGIGVALVPRIAAEPLTSGMTIRPIGDSLIHMPIGILRKRSDPLPLASRKLYQALKDELTEKKAPG